jgi:hypothetical protein
MACLINPGVCRLRSIVFERLFAKRCLLLIAGVAILAAMAAQACNNAHKQSELILITGLKASTTMANEDISMVRKSASWQ